jgi:hypothetical protein
VIRAPDHADVAESSRRDDAIADVTLEVLRRRPAMDLVADARATGHE